MIKVQEIVQAGMHDEEQLESSYDQTNPEGKTKSELISGALFIAEKLAPGPWSLVISLLGILVN